MLENERVLAIIAARGGSKGLPRKNVLPCGGKPLIHWSVLAATAARHVDRVVVSSDDDEILHEARRAGAETPFVRPPALSTDIARMSDVVTHALDTVGAGFHYAVLLQATSPLRTAADVDGALELLREKAVKSVVSVCPTPKSPHWMFHLEPSGRLSPLLGDSELVTRRQELAPAYVLNGAIYAFSVPWFLSTRTFVDSETSAFVMPPERSVDVDSSMDLIMADALLRARGESGAPW